MAKRILLYMLSAIVVLNMFDAIFTLYGISAGIVIEANPLMSELIDYSYVLFVLVKSALVGLGVVVLWRLRESSLAYVGAGLSFLIYSAIIIWHLHGIGG